MFKKIFLFLIIILVLFTSACGEKQVINSMTPKDMVEYVDKRIDENTPTQTPKYWPATVISVGSGDAVVHLPTDPTGTNLTVANPREITLEIGDEVNLVAINGSLTNAIIDFRKDINFDQVYVDYNTGTDKFGKNSSGNYYGSQNAPFKTLQYAVNRLPKNLNGRTIYIYFDTLDSNEVVQIDKFYGGNAIYIQPIDGVTPRTIYGIGISSCYINVRVRYLHCNGIYDDNAAFRAIRCMYVVFEHCDASSDTYAEDTSGFLAAYGSNMAVVDSVVSNRHYGIFANNISNIYSSNNTGVNDYGLRASTCSTIGKDFSGTQPTGTISDESASSNSVIR
jgi:hypothetical protein